MIRWPGHVKPQQSDSLAMSIDLAPTLLVATGLKPTPRMPGINLLDSQTVAGRTAVFGECFTHNSKDLNQPAASLRWRWMISSEPGTIWKLIVPSRRNEPKGHVELYNLSADPTEEHNIAAEQSERVEVMQKKIDAWWPANI